MSATLQETGVDRNQMANALRFLAVDAVEAAQSGHPGLPMGMADVATVLYTRHLRFDASDPEWPDRDRFVLSGGHGSMLLYALLYLTGNESITLDELKRFRQLGSKTPGHPEVARAHGIETTTGPLGRALAPRSAWPSVSASWPPVSVRSSLPIEHGSSPATAT